MSNDSIDPGVRRERIRRVSRFLKFVSLAAAGLVGGSVLLTFFLPIVAIGPKYSPPSPRSAAGPEAETFEESRLFVELEGAGIRFVFFTWDVAAGGTGIREGREWVARCAAAASCGYGLVGALLFFGLFRGYERGRIFEIESVRRLGRVGGWMMGTWVVALAFQFSKPAWAENVTISFDMGVELLPGLFICLVAWIMEEAHLLAQEQALTV